MDWETLIEQMGSVAKVADALGVSYTTVHSRVYRKQDIPAEWARKLHDQNGIPLHVMRPDLWPA